MENSWSNSLVILVVLLAHGAALGAAALWQQEPSLPEQLPTISGVLISAPPANVVQAPAAAKDPVQPKPEPPKPVAKPKPVTKPEPVAKPEPKPLPKPKQTITPPAAEPEPQIAQTPPAPKPVQDQANSQEGAPVTAPRVDAHQHQNPEPAYPRLSRRRGEEGTVILELLVQKDGSVDEIKIKESSGFPRLDKSAVEAVRRWKYNPATRGGEPIEYRYLQPVTFNLNG